MKIEMIDSPAMVQPTGAKSEPSLSARERAIAALTKANLQSQSPTPESPRQEPVQESRLNNNSVESPVTPAAPAETKATESEEPISSQYAVLARKEKALRARDAQLRAREAAIKAAETPKAPQAPSFDESKYISKDKLQQDLFGTLSELGLTYDQIAAQATNAPSPEQLAQEQKYKAMEAKLAKLEQDQLDAKKSFENQQQDSYKQAVAQIRLEANALVKNGDTYETIRETNSTDDVVDLIEKTFAQDGILLTVEEAAEQVESYLIDEAMKIARIKKIQQRLAPVAPTTSAPGQKTTGTPQQQQMKTLTNQVASTRQLSAKERALLAFEGKLNKN